MPRKAQEVTPYTGPTYSEARIKDAIASFNGYEAIEEGALDRAIDWPSDNKIVARLRVVVKWVHALWGTGLYL